MPGVWGPYKNAVFPGWWMNEGGQSSTGQVESQFLSQCTSSQSFQLIDFMITTHKAYPELLKLAEEQKTSIHVGEQNLNSDTERETLTLRDQSLLKS